MYAYVPNGVIDHLGSLPGSARRLDTDEWVMGLDSAPAELVKVTGWVPVTEQRATLGADQHHGDPIFTVRADDVLADYPAANDTASEVNERTIRSRMAAALQANATFIAANKPATAAAQASAAYDQAKALTRQVNGLLRLIGGHLEGTD